MSGNSEPRGTAREEVAGDVGGGAYRSGGVKCLNPWDSQTIRQYSIDGVYPALSANSGAGQKRDGIVYPVVARTLTAEHDASPCVDRGQNIIAYEPRSMLAENWEVSHVKNALRAGESKSSHVIVFTVDCRNGALNEELSGTIQAKPNGGHSLNFQNPVIYSSGSYGSMSEGVGTLGTGSRATAEMIAVYPSITGPLMANCHPGSYTGQDAFSDMLPVTPSDRLPRRHIVRRLTPLECCRLQGFPDWWEDGVEGSDSARYKMWGNGMALPNMLHVMSGIARQHEKELVR